MSFWIVVVCVLPQTFPITILVLQKRVISVKIKHCFYNLSMLTAMITTSIVTSFTVLPKLAINHKKKLWVVQDFACYYRSYWLMFCHDSDPEPFLWCSLIQTVLEVLVKLLRYTPHHVFGDSRFINYTKSNLALINQKHILCPYLSKKVYKIMMMKYRKFLVVDSWLLNGLWSLKIASHLCLDFETIFLELQVHLKSEFNTIFKTNFVSFNSLKWLSRR